MALETSNLTPVPASESLESAGIPFGSAAAMPPFTPRQRDRRETMSSMLASLARALDRRLDVSLMRGAFEAALAQVVPVRSVHLRKPAPGGAAGSTGSPESVALEYRQRSASAGTLEVTFDPGCRLGDWDFQMLGTAANLGALVLELEQSRLQLARGLLNQAGCAATAPHR